MLSMTFICFFLLPTICFIFMFSSTVFVFSSPIWTCSFVTRLVYVWWLSSDEVCVCVSVCVCVCASVQLPPSKTENTTVKMSFVGWVGGRGRNFLRHLPVPETPTKDQVCQMREIAGAHSPVVHSLLPPRFHTHTVLTLASTHTHSASAITAPRLAAGGGGGG